MRGGIRPLLVGASAGIRPFVRGLRCGRPGGCVMHLREHDPQTQIRRVSIVFEEKECKDWQAPQPGDILNPGTSQAARARGAELQEALIESDRAADKRSTRIKAVVRPSGSMFADLAVENKACPTNLQERARPAAEQERDGQAASPLTQRILPKVYSPRILRPSRARWHRRGFRRKGRPQE